MNVYLERRDLNAPMNGLCECFLFKCTGEQEVALAHVHEHFELLYCTSGSFELWINEGRFLLTEGSAALIDPMEAHQSRALTPDENAYIVLKFMPEALASAEQAAYEMKYILPYLRIGARRKVYTADELSGSHVYGLLTELLTESAQQSFGYEMAIRANVERVFLWFLRAWHAQNPMDELAQPMLTRLQLAFAYMEAHAEENIGMEEVAEHCGMGYSTFSRFFAQATHKSFPAYLVQLRLSKASIQLIRTRQPITEIALESGFSTTSYFIQCFRKRFQLTPREYRRLYQQM
ncbi:MAG: AraC family transcriptional regulator [Eubacteriales bacterium]|nr:AraC family transcriptional regulator [Eubacteriales bacterium]